MPVIPRPVMHMLAPCETRAPSPPGRCASLVRGLLLFVNSWFRHQGLTHQLLLASRIRPIRGLGRHRGVPPAEPAPSSYTYMGSPGLPGPAGPAKSVSGVSSSSSWRRSPDLLGFWRDRGLLDVVMTPAEPDLNCSGTCTTL